MKTRLISSLMTLLLVALPGQVALGAASPDPAIDATTEGPVYVDSTEILYLESFPVQVRLVVRGSLPTPCDELRSKVQQTAERIDVRLWSQGDPELICVQVLEPFEASIPLGSFESASLPVFVDGEEVGRVEIGGEPGSLDTALVGAGWSFGMCAGYCLADLVVDGERLVLTGSDRMTEEPLYVNQGALTELGLERIDSALAALQGVVLEPVYGCPDCADGGAAYLTLARDGTTSRHEMEFSQPPEVLAELHDIAMAMITALETCVPDDLVSVDDGCAAWEG